MQADDEQTEFYDEWLDGLLKMNRKMMTDTYLIIQELVQDSLDWLPAKFATKGPGPKIVLMYAQFKAQDKNGKWQDPFYIDLTGKKRKISVGWLPLKQSDWFYTSESGASKKATNKWRCGANGLALFPNDTDGLLLVVVFLGGGGGGGITAIVAVDVLPTAAVVGCCWLLLVAVGCCWLLLLLLLLLLPLLL